MMGTLFVGAAMNSKQAMKRKDERSQSEAASAERLPAGNQVDDAADALSREAQLLLEIAQGGDLAAYGELVRKYQTRVLTVAYGILRNREDAEDVVQEGFLKAYRNLNNFRGQSSFYTWLYRIVFNLSIDLSRKKYRRTEMNAGDSLAIDSQIAKDLPAAAGPEVVIGRVAGPEQELQRSQLRTRIGQAMDSLSEDHRAVVMLREIDGLSYSEIAEVVGCTKGTVMSRLHHARRRLQRILAEFAPLSAAVDARDRQSAENEKKRADEHQGDLP